MKENHNFIPVPGATVMLLADIEGYDAPTQWQHTPGKSKVLVKAPYHVVIIGDLESAQLVRQSKQHAEINDRYIRYLKHKRNCIKLLTTKE